MNIIFILLDDLGWNDVGLHNLNVSTPNINQLAIEGCELTRNYTFSVCGPTRAMIQTGIHAYKYGMQELLAPWNYYGLDSNLKIIPQYLSEIDYSCFAIGKWHLGHNDKKWMPHNRGYKLHYGNLTGCVNHVSHKNCSTNIHDFSENGKAIYPKGHSCDLLTDKTIEVIRENKEKKFFIYLAYNSPHMPLICPEEFKKSYKIKDPKKSYLGMITHLDYNLGRIFNELKNLNIFDETMIWMQSDNGGWTPDWAGGDNYPLKGGKASYYEGGVKVFTIIKNKEIKSKKYEGFCHCTDVLPTLLDFAGYPNKVESIDGISNKKYIIENKKNERSMILNFYSEKFWCFIIENFKFINENDKPACYDLIKDPEEKTNIFKDKYEQFKNKINKMISDCAKEYVPFPNFRFENENQEIIKDKCKNVKFWGQRNKKDKKEIKILVNLETSEPESFLKLSGYDIFYK